MADQRKTIEEIGEFGLIDEIRRFLDRAGHSTPPSIPLAIGDDAAILRPVPDRDQVVTCDIQIAGRHFLANWMTPHQIGRRAMMVNLSDLAAMGARPRHALVSLGLHPHLRVNDVLGLYDGFLAAFADCTPEGEASLDPDNPDADNSPCIVGGNISSVSHEWFCDIAMIGDLPRDSALTRGGAHVGDIILVTGQPGTSAAGLQVLTQLAADTKSDVPDLDDTGIPGQLRPGTRTDALSHFLAAERWMRPLIQGFLEPTARVEVGRLLRSQNLATAAIDLSDGLPGDLMHLSRQSNRRARIDVTKLGSGSAMIEAARRLDSEPWRWVLMPSDDYELLFTSPPDQAGDAADLVRGLGIDVTSIGVIEDGEPGIAIDGVPKGEAPPEGWDHFSSP